MGQFDEEKRDEYAGLMLENQLCFPLYAAARKIVSTYTPFLKPLGITYTQYIIFMVLWEERSITVRDLGKKLYLDSGTLTPVLKKMEQAGWVVRKRSGEDERVVIVTLTDEGAAIREDVKDVPGKMGACVPLTEEEFLSLHRLLYKLLAMTETE